MRLCCLATASRAATTSSDRLQASAKDWLSSNASMSSLVSNSSCIACYWPRFGGTCSFEPSGSWPLARSSSRPGWWRAVDVEKEGVHRRCCADEEPISLRSAEHEVRDRLWESQLADQRPVRIEAMDAVA